MLDGASLIETGDTSFLREIFSASNQSSWVYFPPFICTYSLPPARPVYALEGKGFFVIAQYISRRGEDRIDLIVPPLPLSDCALEWLGKFVLYLSRCRQQRQLRILWVDDEDKNLLSEKFGNSVEFQIKDSEYLYDPSLNWHMKGRKFRDFRKRIHRVQRLNPMFKEMDIGDTGSAYTLMRRWRKLQGRKNGFLLDWGYTRSALEKFHQFSKNDLSVWNIEIDGDLKAFAMAGPINKTTACFFIAKSDPRIIGLSEYLRWRVCGEMRSYDLLNDAGDLGIAGLQQHKMKLRPVGFNTVYKAVLSAG
ncbi:MAG: phosphatidylglycerol lysyltransferase domain-containing protein [Chloroflexota bacterium]|nr:phosphatidylglycerol lysyltransferase domain-containing protein [Chloroflexota bacterium]